MKILASILLILSLTVLAAAQKTTYAAYTVAGVQQISSDVYTATVNVVTYRPDRVTPIPANGSVLRITTTGCTHVPVKTANAGSDESAIVSDGPLGRSLLFSGGMTCKIAKIEIRIGTN